MQISITPIKLLKSLLYTILFLFIFNFLYILAEHIFNNKFAIRYLKIFNFDREASIPTLFSCLLLFLSSVLLYLISLKENIKKILHFQWVGLALIFLFLTIDEMVSFHELLSFSIRNTLEISSGFLYFAWVIPYAIFCIFLVVLYFNFLKRLPAKTRMLIIISGVIFCTGAIGLELLGGNAYNQIGSQNLIYFIFGTIEETLEMLGITLFIYALTYYISNDIGTLTVSIENKVKS